MEIYGILNMKFIIQTILIVATTRPETMFGDLQSQYTLKIKSELDRKKVVIPLTNKIIPIISDEYADPKRIWCCKNHPSPWL